MKKKKVLGRDALGEELTTGVIFSDNIFGSLVVGKVDGRLSYDKKIVVGHGRGLRDIYPSYTCKLHPEQVTMYLLKRA